MAVVPNLITVARIVAAPLIVLLLLEGRMTAAFIIFVLAGLSDAVDGLIARRIGGQTALGSYLDPLADKVLLICVFVTLGVLGDLPRWVVVLVAARDIAILGAVLLAMQLGRPLEVRPLIISKAATAAQLVLAALVMADLGRAEWVRALEATALYLVAALTLVSAAAYLLRWLRHMGGDAEPGGPGR